MTSDLQKDKNQAFNTASQAKNSILLLTSGSDVTPLMPGGRKMGVSDPSLIVDETSMTSNGIFTVGKILRDVGEISFVILVSEGFA